MKTRFVISLWLVIFVLPCFAQSPAEKLKGLTQSANIPGIQLVLNRGGHTESYNIGVTAEGWSSAVTDASIFEAASLSKAVFAYSVLRLADRGVIALDTPLLYYLGGTYERFDPANAQYQKITARLVLCHRTGFRNWADDGPIPLLFPPDSCFNYSGQAYMFLLTVVERLTHKNLNELAEEETFGPLGMHNTSFRWEPKFAGVSTFGDDSEAVNNHQALNAASSLLTNAHDYSLFLDAVASGKGLQPATHRLMLSKVSAGNWFNHPEISATAHIGWGLGVGIQQNERGQAIWQWGDNGDFKAFYIAFPATGDHLVYFTHSKRGLYIAQDVVDLFLGKQTTWALPWVRNGYPHDPYEIGYERPYAINAFREALVKRGFANARKAWTEIEKKDPAFMLSAGDLRAYATILRETKQNEKALVISRLNATVHPRNASALEDLADSYASIGDKKLAIDNLKKCLALDPKNKDATEKLKALKQ